jgi:hypothetical protein
VNVNVQVGGAQARSAELVLGRLPVIIDFTPTRGPLGERVTLRGRGFAPDPKGNVVTFGGGRALIVSASTNELVFSLPPPASPRAGTQIPIAVQVGQNRTASQTPFFLIQTSSGVFIPRFFAAPVTEHLEHDHALVSTELGPLLLLTGPSGSTSVAERAMSAAAALNSVFDQEGAPPPRLEGRDDGIALAGRTELLVPLTPVDLEGYGEAWEGAPRRRIPARVLAPYGAALLEDFHVLFVQRQRPMKVLELSARGRALSEIYTETQRRSGPGAGVPVSLVRPPTASLARALREMALLPPADAGGRAAAAVEGVWEGSMDEAGLGSKPIRLRFRTDGAELRGFITTRSGGIALETGLQKVTYSRGGSLRFSLAAGGTVREFRGQLAGATLEGTIHDEGGADAGRFSLRFVE